MAKRKPRKNKDREERIGMEIIVDAYGSEGQAMGWYYYLEEKLQFPGSSGLSVLFTPC
jgi:endonuclease I